VVRLRTALASSLNVPAVFTLSRVGLTGFLDTLNDLGFILPKDAPSRYGLGTAIGNAEVSLLELARAFSVFPRGGTLPDIVVLDGQRRASRRIFDIFSAWMICDILSDPSARATGFGTRTFFRTPFPAMFKSGTSSEFTNLWCLGATPRYTVGVWAGNFDGRAVINKTGSIVPTQILTDVLIRLTGPNPAPGRSAEFLPPANVVEVRVCSVTGKSATPRCPSARKEYFRSAAEVPETCAWHEHPESRQTLLQQSFLGVGETARILFPVTGQVLYRDETLRAGVQGVPLVVVVRQGQEARLSVDGAEVAHGTSFSEMTLPLARGTHSIVVKSGGGSDRVIYDVR
jgi:penicillin-binding protein 1C